MRTIIVFLAFIIFGCGGSIHFIKEGGTQQALERDVHDCQQGPPGIDLSNRNIPTRAQWIACVERKGWRIESMKGVPGYEDRQAPPPVPQEKT